MEGDFRMADRVTTESQRLQAFATVHARVETLMADLLIPGVALGILDGGWVRTAGFGVTNVEQPRPVDATTLFRIASTVATICVAPLACSAVALRS